MRAAYFAGYRGRNPKIPKELEGWTYWFEHATNRGQAELIATRYKKAGFSKVRIILRPGGVLNIPIFLVEGYAPPGYGGRNPRREGALRQMRAIHWARGKRNPGMTETIGNLLGGMGLLAIPVFTGLILWIQSKQK